MRSPWRCPAPWLARGPRRAKHGRGPHGPRWSRCRRASGARGGARRKIGDARAARRAAPRRGAAGAHRRAVGGGDRSAARHATPEADRGRAGACERCALLAPRAAEQLAFGARFRLERGSVGSDAAPGDRARARASPPRDRRRRMRARRRAGVARVRLPSPARRRDPQTRAALEPPPIRRAPAAASERTARSNATRRRRRPAGRMRGARSRRRRAAARCARRAAAARGPRRARDAARRARARRAQKLTTVTRRVEDGPSIARRIGIRPFRSAPTPLTGPSGLVEAARSPAARASRACARGRGAAAAVERGVRTAPRRLATGPATTCSEGTHAAHGVRGRHRGTHPSSSPAPRRREKGGRAERATSSAVGRRARHRRRGRRDPRGNAGPAAQGRAARRSRRTRSRWWRRCASAHVRGRRGDPPERDVRGVSEA